MQPVRYYDCKVLQYSDQYGSCEKLCQMVGTKQAILLLFSSWQGENSEHNTPVNLKPTTPLCALNTHSQSFAQCSPIPTICGQTTILWTSSEVGTHQIAYDLFDADSWLLTGSILDLQSFWDAFPIKRFTTRILSVLMCVVWSDAIFGDGYILNFLLEGWFMPLMSSQKKKANFLVRIRNDAVVWFTCQVNHRLRFCQKWLDGCATAYALSIETVWLN